MTKTREQLDPQPLLDALEAKGAVIIGPTRIRCFVHDDTNASAGIFQGDDGVYRFKCHRCDFKPMDVFDVLGTKPPGERKNHPPAPPVTRKPRHHTLDALVQSYVAWLQQTENVTYECTGRWVSHHPETRRPEYASVRFEDVATRSKRFLLATFHSDNKWTADKPASPVPLYNRARIAALPRDQPVFLVEGHRKVEFLHKVGFVATSALNGAKSAPDMDWSALTGRHVVLWPDADDDGKKYCDTAAALIPSPASLRVVDPSYASLTNGQDCVDLIEIYGEASHNFITDIITNGTHPWQPTLEIDRYIARAKSGLLRAMPWPGKLLTRITRALIPETITVLYGGSGVSKSFWINWCILQWLEQGYKPAVCHLEISLGKHSLRALAQLAGEGEITNEGEIELRPATVDKARLQFGREIAAYESCCWAPNAQGTTHAKLLEWTRKKVKEGCHIIIIDPVSMIDCKGKIHEAEKDFIAELRNTMIGTQSRVLLVNHPAKQNMSASQKTGKLSGSMDEQSGSASLQRFVDCVIKMVQVADPKPTDVRSYDGRTFSAKCNRLLEIHKTRNGTGMHLAVGYTFDDTLRFTEQGLIL